MRNCPQKWKSDPFRRLCYFIDDDGRVSDDDGDDDDDYEDDDDDGRDDDLDNLILISMQRIPFSLWLVS